VAASDLEVTAVPAAGGLLAGLVRTARPKQWVKNLLVLAAPLASGFIDRDDNLLNALIALTAFCLAASGTYFWNDARDVEADRAHPTKRNRPVAAGTVPVAMAWVIGAVLVGAAIGISFLATWQLAVTTGAYVAITTSYTLWLKEIAVVDVVAIASGFVLRAIAGGTATGILISDWFFIIASFGSLLMVVGKRQGEQLELGGAAASVRTTLGTYSEAYLAYLRSVASGVVLVAYCLWAFEKSAQADTSVPLYQVSLIPFAVAILRYSMLVDLGRGASPEELVFEDRPLLLASAAWAAVFGLAVYTL
jgi:decaprenyl-phosphate phosphoribosyltransferase